VATVLLVVSAIGVALVGIFPLDTHTRLHAAGAVLHLVGAGLGLLALAYGLRPRSEALGTTLVLLGLVGTAMTVFFLVGVTDYLGRGGTERGAAYVLPIALALTGGYLWRFGVSTDATDARQVARRAERELRAERKAERDAALEAAAQRAESSRAEAHVPDPDLDPDDPWATPGRRRRD
jgi:peptidoglycan/LPS O-acetylase OafA/YrhL